MNANSRAVGSGRATASSLSIFDSSFNGMPRSEMYRALIFPDLFPHEKPMLIEGWTLQDRQEYCGGIYAT